jgi:hypothetical protein
VIGAATILSGQANTAQPTADNLIFIFIEKEPLKVRWLQVLSYDLEIG